MQFHSGHRHTWVHTHMVVHIIYATVPGVLCILHIYMCTTHVRYFFEFFTVTNTLCTNYKKCENLQLPSAVILAWGCLPYYILYCLLGSKFHRFINFQCVFLRIFMERWYHVYKRRTNHFLPRLLALRVF